MNTLVVTNPFGGHAVGDRITDANEIASILAGGNAHHAVRADHDDAHVPAESGQPAPEQSEPETGDTEEA